MTELFSNALNFLQSKHSYYLYCNDVFKIFYFPLQDIYILQEYILTTLHESSWSSSIHIRTYIYFYKPVSSCIYLYLPVPTPIYLIFLYLPVSSYIYLYLPLSTCIFVYLPLSSYIYLYLPISTCIYI